MKFSLILAPIASLAVLAHGDEPATAKKGNPISFTGKGVTDVIDVATESPKANGEEAVKSVKAFFGRNPAIIKSILKVAEAPEHKQAKDEVMKVASNLYASKGDSVDIHDAGVKAINLVYEKPEILELIQKAGSQVKADNPTLVDDFFATLEKTAEKNPAIIHNIKKYVIDFSESNAEEYKKVFEMALKSAMINPDFASHLAVHALLVDQKACPGSATGGENCSCDDKYKVDMPEVETEVPEIETPEPEPETYGRPEPEPSTYEVDQPEVETEVPEIETPEPEPEVYEKPEPSTYDVKEPEVDVEVPEIETPEPEPEVYEKPEPKPSTYDVKEPGVDVEEPEIETPEPEPEVYEKPEPEPSTYEIEKPDVNTEIPEIETPVPEPEPSTYDTKKPEVDTEVPEVVTPEPIPEPEVPVTYERPSPPPVPSTYERPEPIPEPKDSYTVTAPPQPAY